MKQKEGEGEGEGTCPISAANLRATLVWIVNEAHREAQEAKTDRVSV